MLLAVKLDFGYGDCEIVWMKLILWPWPWPVTTMVATRTRFECPVLAYFGSIKRNGHSCKHIWFIWYECSFICAANLPCILLLFFGNHIEEETEGLAKFKAPDGFNRAAEDIKRNFCRCKDAVSECMFVEWMCISTGQNIHVYVHSCMLHSKALHTPVKSWEKIACTLHYTTELKKF